MTLLDALILAGVVVFLIWATRAIWKALHPRHLFDEVRDLEETRDQLRWSIWGDDD